MHAPHTFLYTENRHGVAYESYEFICPHGYESQTCGVGMNNVCPQTGALMVEWERGVFKQMRERMVVRNRILNGETA